MVKLGIITAETIMIKTKTGDIPAILLIGRNEKGEKKIWRTVFYPYLYLTEDDYLITKSQLEKYVIKVSGVTARSLTKQILTKVTLKDSKYIIDIVRLLRKYNKVTIGKPVFTYEADLSSPALLPIRYLIDNNIRSGVEIEEGSNKLTPIDMNIKLRKWYIDFEALSNKIGGHGPRKEEPIPIVSFYDNYLETLYTLYVINPNWFKPEFEDKLLKVAGKRINIPKGFNKAIEKHVILGFQSEGLLLDALCTMTIEYDWDLLSAWNLERYDMLKWTQRMIVNNLDPKKLSPFFSFSWKRAPYRIKGRILFDSMRGFKRFTDAELRSYSLGSVAEEEELHIEKVPLKKPTQWIWDNQPDILFRRNVNDVLILKALDEKYELIEMFDDLRKEFGALFQEVLINYRILDTALMRFVNNKIILRSAFKGEINKDSFLGAVVIEPKPDKYAFIVQFDFNREYPSMIKAFNIGPETYRDPDYEGPCYKIEYQDKVYKFVKKPKSLLAQLIDFFFKKRDGYEKKYQEAIEKKNEVEIKVWYRKIFNIKKMTNAIYGVMDFPSFRLSKRECSAATAALGRISVEQIKVIISLHDYTIIYGDTDSVFVQLKCRTEEEALEEAKKLAEIINKELSKFFSKTYGLASAPSGLGIKKLYESFLLFAKKNYAGKSFWDEKKGYKTEYDMKGLEAIRSDSSDIERDTIEEMVKSILDGDVTRARTIGKESLNNIKSKVYLPITVAYPLQLKYEFRDYLKPSKNLQVTIPSHIKAALYSNTFLNTDYMRGDKPRRLPILIRGKINKGQLPLFSNEEVYPTEWDWEDQHLHLNGISITEDMEVPQWFISKIDWGKIYDRLEGKINKIMELVK